MKTSSSALMDCFSIMLNNHLMKTIEETRLARLNILLDEIGGVQELANRLKVTYAQVSQWVNQSIDPKSGKPRNISSSSARRIEKVCNKPVAWMDQPVIANEMSLRNDTTIIDLSKFSTDETALLTEVAGDIKALGKQEFEAYKKGIKATSNAINVGKRAKKISRNESDAD